MFQYNAWAIPCNNRIECDDGIDENHCTIANWHRWLAIAAILVFFSTLFIGSLRLKLKGAVETEEIQLDESENTAGPISLNRDKRFELVSRLQDGGKEEAKIVHDYLCKNEAHKIVELKVITVSQYEC